MNFYILRLLIRNYDHIENEEKKIANFYEKNLPLHCMSHSYTFYTIFHISILRKKLHTLRAQRKYYVLNEKYLLMCHHIM